MHFISSFKSSDIIVFELWPIFTFNLADAAIAEYKFDQSVGVPWIIGKIQCVLVGFLSAKIEL